MSSHPSWLDEMDEGERTRMREGRQAISASLQSELIPRVRTLMDGVKRVMDERYEGADAHEQRGASGAADATAGGLATQGAEEVGPSYPLTRWAGNLPSSDAPF